MVKNNKWILYINGYLDAISDINGSQREFYIKLSLFDSSQLSLKDKIEQILDNKNIEILKLEESKKIFITHFLEKLMIFKPFTGLYNSKVDNPIPKKIEEEYTNYILFHLSDYIDFALEEENIKSPYSKEINLGLIKKGEDYFIVVVQKIEDKELIWIFFYNLYKKEKITHLFNNVLLYINTKMELFEEQKKKKEQKKYSNGLTEEENEKLASYLPRIIENGYIEDSVRIEFLKYISEKKIIELEKVLFNKLNNHRL